MLHVELFLFRNKMNAAFAGVMSPDKDRVWSAVMHANKAGLTTVRSRGTD